MEIVPETTLVRKRLPDEIIPVAASQSHAFQEKDKENAAKYAIDLDLETTSVTSHGMDHSGESWLKITLDKVYCVRHVVWFKKNGSPHLTWNCTSADCDICEGGYWCSDYSMIVESERETKDSVRPVPGCKHGDSVKLQRNSGHEFYMWEIAIVGTQELSLLSENLVATQKSIGWDGEPTRAIDGNRSGEWSDGSCTRTEGAAGNWWMVELNQNYKITKVLVYNRMDCCQDRIDDAKVYAGAVYCGDIKVEEGKQVYEISCQGAVAGSIRIVQPYDYLTICEVEAFGIPTDDVALENVATGKPDWQSSTGWGGLPSRATDGNINGIWARKTCSHSANNHFNMWKVNLIEMYDVDSVVIYNRVDCCQPRLDGVQVYVGKTLCGAVKWETDKTVYRVSCFGTAGNTVKVAQDDEFLALCEVEVLGKPSVKRGQFINVAGDGKATQSSTGWNGVAGMAIDGDTNGDLLGGSCSHTGNVDDGWWNLEFPDPVDIRSVVIYDRTDCCRDRIDGVKVYADEMLCGEVNYVWGQGVYVINCESDTSENVFGTNIRIEAAPKQYLALCEVKVFSDPTAEVGEDRLVNLAYLRPTSQSSTEWGGVSSRAVDGNEAGAWKSGACTHTASAGWWMVDLEDNYIVNKVWVKNRIDCCGDRIDGVKIYVGDVFCGTIKYDPLKFSYEVICKEGQGIVGDTVKLVNDKTYLTLCEVRVWGPKEPVVINVPDVEVIGDMSDAADDAVSIAGCSAGQVVIYCDVFTGNVGLYSDGVLVNPNTGSSCSAYNSAGGQGVIAKAVCSQSIQIKDPCNGPKLLKYIHFYNKGPNPSLECPVGYEPTICNAHSNWDDLLADQEINDKGIIPNDKACAVSGCEEDRWCDITLVCKLMDDLVAYAAAVCPDCGGWNCDQDEDCDMVEQLPTCSLIQTGCDVDKCGEHGECEEVGATDYKCHCEDGFEFDLAGTCLPRHSKYRTVYGENAIGDDARSYASCKEGERVMSCHTFGAPSAADGVTITSSGAVSRCEARASNSVKFPILAVAYCGNDTVYTDPCTQDTIHGMEYRYNTGQSPYVTCPDGYFMQNCLFHSPWSQSLTSANKARIKSISSIDVNDDDSCSMDNCLDNPSASMWCKLTAICKKLTGAEYLKEACPTCEDVRCPVGEECNMVHDLPVCLPRVHGGCEVARCGQGDCQEDEADYKCLCYEGYRFNGVTCTDIDECVEEDPCGNGLCNNTIGSHTCDCDEGYVSLKGTCEDINECLADPCDETERCSNIEGSYICDCLDSLVRDHSTGDCMCADGFEEDKDGTCVDIDECELDPCKDNEDCFNTDGNYHCECREGTERGEGGVCQEMEPGECEVMPIKSVIGAFRGNNVNVKLRGESKKTFKKDTRITWTRNNEPWNPDEDGTDKMRGFIIRDFDPEDAGVYVGSIFIDQDGKTSKCQFDLKIELLDGSVSLRITNKASLMRPQKAGKILKIKCDVDMVKVKLDDPKNPDNINWYKVTADGEVKLDDDSHSGMYIKKGAGNYQLIFTQPKHEDSGTYRCEFDQMGVSVSTDVTIDVV
ncbi:uncharacterized protein LOC134825361 [Bolinopsis microptera]|uniref:uncharacterized protein LOC134825361 n=1 Tax=Bolinopsis microptera TaxID=2820187 RepID=UPI00307A460A